MREVNINKQRLFDTDICMLFSMDLFGTSLKCLRHVLHPWGDAGGRTWGKKASRVSSFFANTMVILPLKTSENYRVHFISWDVEKGHQRMHYIRQQIFRRPHVCSTWDCSKLRLGKMRLLILQGVEVFHVIQFYILNNAKVDTKRMNNWMVQKQLPYQLVITLDCFLCSQASRAAQDSWWNLMNHPEIGVRSL